MDPLLVGRTEYRIFAAISAVLVLKMVLTAYGVGLARGRARSWANQEDIKLLGGSTDRDDLVERLRRLHLNSLENEPLFVLIGLLYVVAGAPVVGIQAYGYTFLIARLVHAVAYVAKVGLVRTLAYFVCSLALLGMAIQVFLAAFV